MLLTSIQTFYHFTYTISPSSYHFTCLQIARDCFLSCYACMKWRETPVIHYCTTHAIVDAITDGTAYFTLQEGAEHLNHINKVEYRNTYINPHPSNPFIESSWQYLINQGQLRLHLLKQGYSMSPYELIPANSNVTYYNYPITKPMYSPV